MAVRCQRLANFTGSLRFNGPSLFDAARNFNPRTVYDVCGRHRHTAVAVLRLRRIQRRRDGRLGGREFK